ncbi:MAG: hypothetical protein IPM42_21985 [Saprospiraceae bacterium]|nr:hypothetical protein [Saprospiraceae bacterium]
MSDIKTKVALITAIDNLIDTTAYNGETQGLLQGLFALVQQNNRSFEREKSFKLKKTIHTTAPSGKTMPPNAEFSKEDFEKKTVRKVAEPVKEQPKAADPEPMVLTEDEIKTPSNESEILDLVTDGLDKAKANFKTPAQFKKKLAGLGIDSKGKTYEEIFEDLKAAFNNLK